MGALNNPLLIESEYCRGDVSRPIALSPDGRVLCFDGMIARDLDVSRANGLKQDGLFVVRSSGGNAGPAIELSNLVRDRHATVVIYDHCFSACAVFFFVASHQTYVLKGGLVVWHNPVSPDAGRPYCNSLKVPLAGGPMKVATWTMRRQHVRRSRCIHRGMAGSDSVF
jgi:hypothetical protein